MINSPLDQVSSLWIVSSGLLPRHVSAKSLTLIATRTTGSMREALFAANTSRISRLNRAASHSKILIWWSSKCFSMRPQSDMIWVSFRGACQHATEDCWRPKVLLCLYWAFPARWLTFDYRSAPVYLWIWLAGRLKRFSPSHVISYGP